MKGSNKARDRSGKDQQDLMSLVGDPVEVDQALRRYRKSANILSAHEPRMIDMFPSQWVAVYDGKVRAQGQTLTSLMVQVDKSRLPREEIIVRRIERNPKTLIL